MPQHRPKHSSRAVSLKRERRRGRCGVLGAAGVCGDAAGLRAARGLQQRHGDVHRDPGATVAQREG